MASDSQIVIIPAPPRPPVDGWTVDYGNQLNRWLENLSRLATSVSYGRFNGLYLADSFPVSAYDLKPGEVFANAGILTVVRSGDVGLSGTSVTATGTLGTITVTP